MREMRKEKIEEGLGQFPEPSERCKEKTAWAFVPVNKNLVQKINKVLVESWKD